MQFDPIIPAARSAAMKAAGHWRDRVLLKFLDAAIARRPDRIALVDHDSMTGVRTELASGELGERVERIALGLLEVGVAPGDVVSYQLPPDRRLDFEELISFLKGHKLAKEYLPERLEIIAEMPKTPSGKIQKFKLRKVAESFPG